MNLELISLCIIYFSTILIGFKIKKKDKQKHSKKYPQFRIPIQILIATIHTINLYLLFKTYEFNKELFSYLIIIQLLFSTYYFTLSIHKTKYWTQTRNIVFNFLLILEIYIIAQLSLTIIPYYLLLLINIYNIAEFQFSKFNIKKITLI